MNIRLFNREYTVRRFSEQKNVRGYFVSAFEDFTVKIDVGPSGTDAMHPQPEGQNKTTDLDGWGESELHVADVETGTKGDMLWYHGDWYECVSCRRWDHTILNHYNYRFAMVPRNAKESCLASPEGQTEVTESGLGV